MATVPRPRPDRAALVGAGDGSVMLYCRACRQCVSPVVRDLDDALTRWTAHGATHEAAS